MKKQVHSCLQDESSQVDDFTIVLAEGDVGSLLKEGRFLGVGVEPRLAHWVTFEFGKLV